MGNPSLLLLDADALNQLLIATRVPLLRRLRSEYGIRPAIVPEVEIEIVSSKRFGNRFHGTLKKAISNGVIARLDSATYPTLLTHNPALQAAAVGTSYADIQARGAAYARRVDSGEAYTFAAAVALGQPAMSNDMSAIRVMSQANLQLPSTVLRAFDLIVFAHQVGWMTEQECDGFRQTLLSESESLPASHKSRSFADGLRHFIPRLIDGSRPVIGLVPPEGARDFSSALTLTLRT